MEFAITFLIWVLIGMILLWGTILGLALVTLASAKAEYLKAQRSLIS